MKRIAITSVSLIAGVWVVLVANALVQMPGAGACHCEPVPPARCVVADYLHRQNTAYWCGGEVRWGSLP